MIGQAGGRQRRQARRRPRDAECLAVRAILAPAGTVRIERLARRRPTARGPPGRADGGRARAAGGCAGTTSRRRMSGSATPTDAVGAQLVDEVPEGAPRRPAVAAAANATTTSRRRAPPWGVSEITPAKRCSSSRRGDGSVGVPAADPSPGPARRRGRAASTPERARRYGVPGSSAGRVAAHATRPARAERAPTSCMRRRMSARARGELAEQLAAPRPRSRADGRALRPNARPAPRRGPPAGGRRRPPTPRGRGPRSRAGRTRSTGRPPRGPGSPSRRGCAGGGRRCD